jgi:peptide/nickel transport system permease protein
MLRDVIRRLWEGILVLWLLSILVFFGMRFLPGDPILMIITSAELVTLSPERIEQLRREHGLDQPVIIQYANWVKNVFLRGDLGRSIVYKEEVSKEILKRLPVTLHIGLSAFILGTGMGVTLGVLSAIRRGTMIDLFSSVFSIIGITAPAFWTALVLIYLFSVRLKLLPVFGYIPPWQDLWGGLYQSMLPITVLALLPMAVAARQTRSSVLEMLNQDFVRTAWAKGLQEREVIVRHVLKNALIPVVVVLGIVLRLIISGSIIVETVFAIPGIGSYTIAALNAKDFPVVQGIALILGASTVLINIVVDVICSWLDPRARYV